MKHRDFYVTSAQIIPVLLLALGLDLKFFDPPPGLERRSLTTRGHRLLWAVFVVVLTLFPLALVAETVAVTSLASGDDSRVRRLIVGWGVVLLAVFVVNQIVGGILQRVAPVLSERGLDSKTMKFVYWSVWGLVVVSLLLTLLLV